MAEAEEKAAKEHAAREKHEARVSEVQQDLQDAVKKYESLERDSKTQESELTKAHQSAHDARVEAQGALQEVQEARKIATSKAFIMQSKYVNAAGKAFYNAEQISDAAEFYRAEEGSSMEKLFWSQYLGPEHPVPFSDQLK